MAKFETTGFIQRPPQQVFEYVSDPANLAAWQANTRQAGWTSSGEPGVGSTFQVVVKNGKGGTETLMRVTVWEPPQRFGFESVRVPFPVKRVAGLTLFTSQDGGTQLTLQGQVEAQGAFKLLEGQIVRQVKQQDAANIQALKRALEG